MFNLGDRVEISDEFEGSVVVAGWDRNDIEKCIFEVVSFEEYERTNPKFAKHVKGKPTRKDAFLLCIFPYVDEKAFAFYPADALKLLEAAEPVCRCPIQRLWAGNGHDTGCPKT